MSNAFFDANAPYTPAAVGIYSNLGRRPSHEWTHRNKNIAVFYCSLRVLGNAIPDQVSKILILRHITSYLSTWLRVTRIQAQKLKNLHSHVFPCQTSLLYNN